MASDATGSAALSVATYARVKAALAEGFSLAEVLRVEGIAEPAWATADAAWKEQLADDADAFDAYARALAIAEDKLGRAVKPVDSDVAAWLALLDAYRASPTPAAWLEELGLRSNDLSRLGRQWDRRMRTDAAVGAQVIELRRGSLPPLPPLELGASRLERPKASPRAEPGGPAAPPRVGALELEGFDLLRYAALQAELSERPREAVLAAAALDAPGLERIEAAFTAALDADPAAARDFAQLFAHQRSRVRAMAAAAAGAPLVAAAPRQPPAATAPEPPPVAAVPAQPPKDRTVQLRGGGAAVTLPFARAVAAPRGGSLPRSAPLAPRLDAGSTVETDGRRAEPALPFGTPLMGTVAPWRRAGPELPSGAGSSEPAEASEPAPGGGPAHDGQTIAASGPAPDALPFAREDAGALALTRAITLERHASLQAELGQPAARLEEVLARYRITEEQKNALDRHYAELTARDPAARAAWREAFRRYAAYLKGTGGLGA